MKNLKRGFGRSFGALWVLAILSFSSVGLAADSLGDHHLDASWFNAFVKDHHGKIPFPFRELKSEVAKYLASSSSTGFGSSSDDFSVPDGRSLQRKNATYAQPRQVADPNTQTGQAFPKIFLGYAPKAGQVEIQSWNPETLRYDFLLLEGYESGKQSTVVEAERNICLNCHQNGAAILSHFPWAETTFNSEIRAKIGAARKVLVDAEVENRSKPQNVPSDGFSHSPPVFTDRDSVQRELFPGAFGDLTSDLGQNLFAIDADVRKANRVVQAVHVCKDFCGNDLNCRQFLVGMALVPNQDTSKMDKKFNELYGARWPKDGFGYTSSIIPDRDPLMNPDQGGVTTVFTITDRGKFLSASGFSGGSPGSFALAGSIDLGDGRGLVPFKALAAASAAPGGVTGLPDPSKIEGNIIYSETPNFVTNNFLVSPGMKDVRLYGLRKGSMSDPNKPRPLTNQIAPNRVATEISPVLSACFGLTNGDIADLAKSSPARIEDALHSPELQSSLKSWPPKREKLMAAIHSALERSYKADAKESSCKECSEEASFEAHSSQLSQLHRAVAAASASASGSADLHSADILKKYCSKCHPNTDGMPAVPVNNLTKLKAYRDDDGVSVADYLKKKIMPPRKEAQLTDEDRVTLIQSLEGK